MIRVSVFYPQGASFNEDYYINNHMPMVAEKLGDALVKWEADKGVAGAAPGSPPLYVAAAHMYFNSLPEFVKAFGPNAPSIMADIPNYTDGQAQVQISEIVVG